MNTDPLAYKDAKNPQNDTQNKYVAHIADFKQKAQKIMMNELPQWLDAQDMYLQCLNPEDDLVNLYNPDLFFDVVQRVSEQFQLADTQLIIPGATDEQVQVIRDAIKSVKKRSGLIAGLRDNPNGVLSLLVLGNSLLWWGANSDGEIAKGNPIKFMFPKLTQVYLSPNATSLRLPNGDSDADEALIVFDFPAKEVKAMFPQLKFEKGRLSFMSNDSTLQSEELATEDDADMTQIGYYYSINDGVKFCLVGAKDTIAQQFDDTKKEEYPHKLDDHNYLPVELLRCFPVLGNLYAKSLYHKFGKIARNDARRRTSAHRYVDRNIDPDRFIEMADENYATFAAKVEEAQIARQQGYESYIQVNPGEKPVFSDSRTQPLTNEFERMKQDIIEQVTQGGVAIRDVDRSPSESATAVAAEEISKTRLPNGIIRSNAAASVFITRVVIEYMKLIPVTCETIVPTNAKVKEIAETPEGDQPTGNEKSIKTVTFGAIAEFLQDHEVFVEEDISRYEGIGLEFAKAQAAMAITGDAKAQGSLRQKALGMLGFEFMSQDMQPNEQPNAQIPNGGVNPNTAQRAGIPQSQGALIGAATR